MQTLSYGYKKPQNPDTGDVFFPAMEFNIQQLNDHDHDGVNSAPLATQTGNVVSVLWVAAPIGGGMYRQSITMPTGLTYDGSDIWFRLSTGEFVYPSVERIDATHFYVYTNDNTIAYVAYFR